MCNYNVLVRFRKLFSFTIFLYTITFANADMDFTYSAADLYRLIQTEQKISELLDDLRSQIFEFIESSKEIRNKNMVCVIDSQTSTLFKNNHPEHIVKNPLLSYQLVKKHGLSLNYLDDVYESFVTTMNELHSSYVKARSTFTKSKESDLIYAMEAIVRLRQTYNLTIEAVAEGQLGHVQIEGSLSPEDLAGIGLYAKRVGMKTNARMFLDAALQQSNSGDTWVHDVQTSLDSLAKEEKSEPDREDFRVLTEMDDMFATDSLENLNRAFEDLCQYYAIREPPISKLKCYLDKSSSPVRKIFPLKIEVYHEDPQVLVIYDFLSDREITALEDATFYKLKRSHTQFYLGGALHSEPSIIRTTSQTWIYDLNHPNFGYLSKRIESVTGYYLSGKHSAEELQIASYRPGGHYSLHTDATQEDLLKDFLQSDDIIQGDRLVTFMVYLTDVEVGGNTAFPMLNVSVRPVKGSAIIWGNLYPDGKIARNTLHGACPVVYGIKNIATKWIRANDQMFTRHRCKPDKSSDHFKLVD